MDAVADRARAVSSRSSELQAAFARAVDTFERLSLIALNAGLEGARLGEAEGRQLGLVSDEVRSQAARGGEATKELAAGLARLGEEIALLEGYVGDAQAAVSEVSQDASRAAGASTDAESALADVGERVRRATGSDPEAVRAIAEASETRPGRSSRRCRRWRARSARALLTWPPCAAALEPLAALLGDRRRGARRTRTAIDEPAMTAERDPELTRLLLAGAAAARSRARGRSGRTPGRRDASALQAITASAGLAGERDLFATLGRLERRAREGSNGALREAAGPRANGGLSPRRRANRPWLRASVARACPTTWGRRRARSDPRGLRSRDARPPRADRRDPGLAGRADRCGAYALPARPHDEGGAASSVGDDADELVLPRPRGPHPAGSPTRTRPRPMPCARWRSGAACSGGLLDEPAGYAGHPAIAQQSVAAVARDGARSDLEPVARVRAPLARRRPTTAPPPRSGSRPLTSTRLLEGAST